MVAFDEMRKPFDGAFYCVDKRTLNEIDGARKRVVALGEWLDGLVTVKGKAAISAAEVYAMDDQRRKSLDEFSEESEQFESRFEGYLAGEADETRANNRSLRLPPGCKTMPSRVASCLWDLPIVARPDRSLKAGISAFESKVFTSKDLRLLLTSILEPESFSRQILRILDLSLIRKSGEVLFLGGSPDWGFVTHLEKPGNRILLVIGASGSGKSSLALAGVLP